VSPPHDSTPNINVLRGFLHPTSNVAEDALARRVVRDMLTCEFIALADGQELDCLAEIPVRDCASESRTLECRVVCAIHSS
jgi:hypothetical protein